MDISEFVTKTAVRKLSLDDEEIIKEYNEPLNFYILMPMPVEKYAKVMTLSKVEFVRDMLVKPDGTPLLGEGENIDTSLVSLVHDRIWVELGKFPGRTKKSQS